MFIIKYMLYNLETAYQSCLSNMLSWIPCLKMKVKAKISKNIIFI